MSKIINFIWIVSKVALLTTILTILAQPAHSITIKEQIQLSQNAENICISYNRPCRVIFFQSNNFCYKLTK